MKNITTVFGAPGCGKTTHLLNTVQDLLKTYTPEEIAYVSFTKKGAYEGRDRAVEKFPELHKDRFMHFRTLHSIAFHTLRYKRIDVIGWKHYKQFSKSMGMRFTGYYTEDFYHNDDQYLFHYFLSNNNKKIADTYANFLDVRKLNFVKHNYIKYKQWAGVKDFDDMMLEFIARNEPLPVKVAIIDEAQDLTTLQWEFCAVAFKNCEKVFVGGDDDQAIYEWSGADIDIFISLPGERVILDKSYRMRKNLLNYSSQFSKLIERRVDKVFDPIDEGGEIAYYNQVKDVPINENESWYFLSRNNCFLKSYTEMLRDRGYLYTYKHKKSVNVEFVHVINMYERMRKGEKLSSDELYTVRRHIKIDYTQGAPWYQALRMNEEDESYYRNIIQHKGLTKKTQFHVSTIHGVKGGEADHVVLLMDVTKNVRENVTRNPDSELRCLYVGVTRARKKLHVVYTSTKNGYEDYFEV